MSRMPGILKYSQSNVLKRKRPNEADDSAAAIPRKIRTSAIGREDDSEESEGYSDSAGEGSTSISDASEEEDERAREALRRAFEKRFAPLPDAEPGNGRRKNKTARNPVKRASGDALDASEDDDDWSGFDSGSDIDGPGDMSQAAGVEVINHSTASADDSRDAFAEREAKRAFMSYKPPSAVKGAESNRTRKETDEDAATAQEHLKNDLALSRLIQESHLLHPGNATQTETKSDFQGRLKTRESRLAALGAKESMLKQKNMPVAIRNGIKNKARERDQKRRAEAKENGIVLEKAAAKKRASGKKRDRSVGNPGIGKFRGGMLTLGKRDVGKLTTPKAVDRKGRRKIRF